MSGHEAPRDIPPGAWAPLACKCAGRRYPARVPFALIDYLTAHHAPPHLPVQTYRCPWCGVTLVATLGDVQRLRPAA